MHTDQIPYRELYDQMLRYKGTSLFDDLVRPWLYCQAVERQWLEAFAARSGDPIPAITVEESWRLYALSRISDLLLLSFAPADARCATAWQLAKVSIDEYTEVMTFFGFSRIDRSAFHPFFHEIIIVEQSHDPETSITLGDECWPGFMLGQLLFSRAGYRVRGGIHHVNKSVAERSTLYWTYARNTRPTEDLSVGWGHNSQWRTSFRRDYKVNNLFYYNVDAERREPDPDEDLTQDEQLELLRNRCFIRCDKTSSGRWPYDLQLREEA